MKRITLAALLTLAFLAIPASALAQYQDPYADPVVTPPIEAPAKLPMLDNFDAWDYMRTALGRKFGKIYRYRVDGEIKCRRSTRTRMRCSIGWAIGDFGFSGSGYIWFSRQGTKTHWNYSWNITRFDYYCRAVQKKPKYSCIKRYVVT